MKAINIKGKDYITVNERIQYFRENFPDLSLETEIVELNDKFVVLKALIKEKDGRIIATGLAREVNGDSYINKTSYVENAETSAWGRALACLGIGIDTSMASAEEVANAIKNQSGITPHGPETNEQYKAHLIKMINACTTLEKLIDLKENSVEFVKGKKYLYGTDALKEVKKAYDERYKQLGA